MKRILILALILSSVQVRGQTSIFKPYQPLSHVVPQKLLPADSSIEVVYIDEFKDSHSGKAVASFLNGKFVDSSVWSTLPRSFIDNVYVVDKTIDIEQVSCLRQYYFTTKSTYTPKLLTLNGLKEKYVKLKTKRTIFTLDGNVIDADYDKYVVDENYILQIVVETMGNTKGNKNIGFIKLLTQSPENIKNSKEIRIRGGEVSMKK